MKKAISTVLSIIILFSAIASGVSAAEEEKGVINVYPDTVNPFKAGNAADSDGPVTVVFHGGKYITDSVIEFTADDRDNVTFMAADGESVSITNSKPVTGWRETAVNGVKVFEASAGGRRISGLFKNDTELEPARYPESGFFYIKSLNPEDDLWTEKTTLWADGTLGQTSFNADTKDIDRVPENLADVTLRIPHRWHDEVTGVKSVDVKTGKITMVKYSAMTFEEGDRYCLENVLFAMDKAGEWCFDSAADRIYYVPFEGETPENVNLCASSDAELLKIDGCKNLTFENIRFENTGWEYLSKEYCTIDVGGWTEGIDMDLPQGAIDACSAVRVINSSGITFRNCDFLNIGTTAVKLADNVSFSGVESCYFDNIGASGVYVGGQNCAVDSPERTHDITVSNNIIGNYGMQFNSAPGVIVTFCDTAQISNNEIHDGYYTGISCGWVWLYGYHLTRNIDIRDNLIYNIGKDRLSDLGGIYMLGTQYGTKISGNVIHDVLCYTGPNGYAGAGIYTDAGASQMLIYQNLVYNCSSYGLNATIATNNSISNNIIAFCGQCLVHPGGRLLEYSAMNNYNHNILLTDNTVPVHSCMDMVDEFVESKNIMWDYTYGDELYFSKREPWDKDTINLKKAVKQGYVDSSFAEDPMFADAGNYDFTLSEDSPAFEAKVGFVQWDYGRAGTLKNSRVGLEHLGGQTAYNDSVCRCELVQANLKFGDKFVRFFKNIRNEIVNFFRKLFGVK